MKTNNSNGQLTVQVNLGDAQKSGFDLSNNVLGTGKLGRIYPTRALHVMPNDTINSKSQIAVQFEPLAVPILSNMHVKREEFYVPYNVVWQNWDKFISGGEKLDYKGVVPNTSMFNIVSNINGYLYGNNLQEFQIKVRESGGSVSADDTSALNYRGISFSTIEDLEGMANDLRTQLKTIGTQFGIEDILVEQREALDNFDKYADNWRSRFGTADPAFDGLLFVTFYQDAYETFNEMWSAYEELYHLTGNPDIDYLKEYIQERTAEVGRIVLPTPLGLDYLTLQYDYFKSFIGAGSILDYLNMSRVTFKDYLYTWLQHFTSEEFGEIGEGSIVTNTIIQLPALFVDQFSQNPLSILHLRANYCVWYNNYRDILLETTPLEPKNTDSIGSNELFTLLVPRQRCWEKDAFTTALDSPGTGNVGVPVGLTGRYTVRNQIVDDVEDNVTYINRDDVYVVGIGNDVWELPTSYLSGINERGDSTLESNGGFSLYQLDAARRAQKWLQKALFFGNRISDFYYMRYGVRFLDARLRLPELLSSSTQLVKLDVVMNNTNITTEAGGEIYQSVAGDRSAYASAYDEGDGYSRFIEEHGVVLSYLTVMPDPTYAYGQSRDYSRLDQFDFAFNEFATLGMDAVYDTEITATPFTRQPLVFGYQGKYYDYKAKHSEEHGELLESQDMYTFGRRFDMFSQDGAPKLNYAFVHCFPPLDMFVVDSKLADYFRFDLHNSTTAERLLPVHSVYI